MRVDRIKTYKSHYIGSSFNLSDQHYEGLIKNFNMPNGKVDSILGGRSSVISADLSGIGPVIIKQYARGGLIKYFIKNRYVKWGEPRCRIEYQLLKKVKNLGINTPEPVAYAFKGRPFYKAWLVTREIKKNSSLASLSNTNLDRCKSIMEKLVDQVAILIKNNILHVDLHPGNVLVDVDDNIFIIDFDKGRFYLKGKNNLRDRYLARWDRAVIKHNLPKLLIEMMHKGLLEKALN